MIIHVLAVDPEDASRVLHYQVPENSREMAVLIAAFSHYGVELTTLESKRPTRRQGATTTRRPRRKKGQDDGGSNEDVAT